MIEAAAAMSAASSAHPYESTVMASGVMNLHANLDSKAPSSVPWYNFNWMIQPDMAKWGGFTRCLSVARRIRAAGLRYCPHFLGGGVGQLASAHLLAAVGGEGLLEIDANPNPLRTRTCGALQRISEAEKQLPAE